MNPCGSQRIVYYYFFASTNTLVVQLKEKTFNNLHAFGINSILLFFFVFNGTTYQTCFIGASGCTLSKTNRGVDDVYLKERGVNIQRGHPQRTPRASKREDAIRAERDALRPARKTQPNKLPSSSPFFFLPSSDTKADERRRRHEINGRLIENHIEDSPTISRRAKRRHGKHFRTQLMSLM